jgi:hypothetical protein
VRHLLVLAVLATAACGGREVTVRVTIPDLSGVETPVPNLLVTFLPYDRDSVIAALEAQAGPRPHAAELDSLFRLFRAPFTAFVQVAAVRDRLARERDSLAAAGAAGPRAATVADSLARLEPEVQRARAALDRAREAYWPRIDSLRLAVQAWSTAAYAGYDSIVRVLPGRRVATPVADTTDARGWATVELTDGRWWATARSLDPGDPNAEWYWNVPLERDTVLLNSRTGRNRPRYR